MFINVELQVWETYNFSFDLSFPSDRPPHLSWMRMGPSPPFAYDSTAAMLCTVWRVCSYDQLPESMRTAGLNYIVLVMKDATDTDLAMAYR